MDNIFLSLPLVALRGLVVYPNTVISFEVARDTSLVAIETAMAADEPVFLVTQRDFRDENPKRGDLFDIGVVAKIRHIIKLQGQAVRLMVEGLYRARIMDIQMRDCYWARVMNCEQDWDDDVKTEAYMRSLLTGFDAYALSTGKISPEAMAALKEIKSAAKLADTVAVTLLTKLEEKQDMLECIDLEMRYKKLIEYTTREIAVTEIERDIMSKTRDQIEKLQRDHFLREQLKAIQHTLGDDGDDDKIEEFAEKIENLPIKDDNKKYLKKELERLRRLNPNSPDYQTLFSYFEWVCDLPWGVATPDNLNIEHARSVLDRDHYGLKKVKERVLEFLAVKSLKPDMAGQILCFAGPPGVGKTSIAKSIAEAIGRNFVRMSLGGLHDEAEIRGHRRTYIGAIPGRIANGLKRAGSMNPLFLLDEIDKLGQDYKGDPASAMLEVLDPTVNNTFNDHYLEIDIDLSAVMFVTTANDISMIAAPLYDRMEIIELSSYTAFEKREIAKKHLLPKQLEANGIDKNKLKLSDAAIELVISGYTSEAGVRELERKLGEICRKAAIEFIGGNAKQSVTPKNLEKYLGIAKYSKKDLIREPRIGVATGLAWTSSGGTVLPVEVSVMDGKGEILLTGQLGEVMQESARTAISLIRSRAEKLGIDPDFYSKKDIHIHVPEGATPKDGPSAGITLALAVTSALKGAPFPADIAMTGEITLTGRVLPIGGLREKALAAVRYGIPKIIVPAANKKDLEEIPPEILEKLQVHFINTFDEGLKATRK